MGQTRVKNEETLRGQTTAELEHGVDGVHAVRKHPISAQKIAALRRKVASWPEEVKRRRIVLVEGILLYSSHGPLSVLTELFDVKVLLRCTYTAAKRRREMRNGYVTLEGFWQDPPGYFDEVVWPGFVKTYGDLFSRGNVEASPVEERVNRLGIRMGPLLEDLGGEEEIEKDRKELESLLEWIVGLLEKEMEVELMRSKRQRY